MKRFLVAIGLILFTTPANAMIIVNNWIITEDSLTFDMRGTIDVVSPRTWPGGSHDSFFIGPANSTAVDWIIGSRQAFVTDNGGDYVADGYSAAHSHAFFGDYIYTNRDRFQGVDLMVGQDVDLSFSITGPGIFNPTVINLEDIIVTIGHSAGTTSIPDVRFATGGGVPVSEPAPLFLLAVGLGMVCMKTQSHRWSRGSWRGSDR